MNIKCIVTPVHQVKRIWSVVKRPIKHIVKTKTFKVTCFVVPGAIGTWEAKKYLSNQGTSNGTSPVGNSSPPVVFPNSFNNGFDSGLVDRLLNEAIKESPQFFNNDIHNTNFIIINRSPELNNEVPEPSTILILGASLFIAIVFKSVIRRF